MNLSTLISLCSAQSENMEIFLFAPNGIGAKFEFSLHAQSRTEKLPRGCVNRLKIGQESLSQALISLCSAQSENMEFRLTSRSVPVSIVAARRPKK